MATTKQIVEKLIAPVPPPRYVPPTPQDSWATLKEGDVLAGPDSNRGLGEQGAELWEVTNVSSAGVRLMLLPPDSDRKLWREGKMPVRYIPQGVELTDRKWKESGWHKVSKRELVKRGES